MLVVRTARLGQVLRSWKKISPEERGKISLNTAKAPYVSATALANKGIRRLTNAAMIL
jgi:hypothetical protein